MSARLPDRDNPVEFGDLQFGKHFAGSRYEGLNRSRRKGDFVFAMGRSDEDQPAANLDGRRLLCKITRDHAALSPNTTRRTHDATAHITHLLTYLKFART